MSDNKEDNYKHNSSIIQKLASYLFNTENQHDKKREHLTQEDSIKITIPHHEVKATLFNWNNFSINKHQDNHMIIQSKNENKDPSTALDTVDIHQKATSLESKGKNKL